MPKQVSAETRAQVVAECQEGVLSTTAIGKRHGLSAHTVQNIARKAGVQMTSSRRAESPIVLAAGDWVYDQNGIARWTPGAVPTTNQEVTQ